MWVRFKDKASARFIRSRLQDKFRTMDSSVVPQVRIKQHTTLYFPDEIVKDVERFIQVTKAKVDKKSY
ncbi:hypothetical protein CL616_04560 [archaeon]|nr:hypothetical protein [archaeon]|tara:strand:+ start:376 stop:579 length:204 start_codon:yes stop_codon:yes gene_type:complete